ncbi:MAG TPA: membrane protein insertase YidC [Gammaproteobacteria bacterium]|nr:membrane protein insertase YidC [Gammaproteobacteria bacterium]
MESQRPFLYLSLLFLGFLIWQAWVTDHAPTAPEPATQTAARQNGQSVPESADDKAADLPQAANATDAPVSASTPQQNRVGATGKTIEVKTDVLDVTITTRGGDVLSVRLPTYPVSVDQPDTPLRLLRPDLPYIAQSGLLHDKQPGSDVSHRAPNHYAIYSASQDHYALGDKDRLEVVLHWRSADGVQVDKIYTFHRGEFYIDVDYRINNGSRQVWIGRQYAQLRHGETPAKSGFVGTSSYEGAAYYNGKFEKLPFKKMTEEPLKQTVNGGWVTMMQHYFLSAWMPRAGGGENLLYSKVVDGARGNEYIIGFRSDATTVAPGAQGTLSSRLYAGPTKQDKLASLAPGLELTIDYGIFTIFSKPLFWLLSKIHAFVGNWGWSIILLTILIKGVFYKLSETSYRSMAKMRKVAPKMQALKERYGDDKAGHQKAMMDLYKKEKINPLGGCLPILIQIPVFIALYWVLIEAVELRQAPWIFWIKDLSIKDPYFVLPVIMGVSMFVQQKLNPPQPDPMMQKMMTAMPLVFTVFFAFFASGLVLYWVVNNLLSIAQQWYITNKLEKESRKT